jgi:hypothetical protein
METVETGMNLVISPDSSTFALPLNLLPLLIE